MTRSTLNAIRGPADDDANRGAPRLLLLLVAAALTLCTLVASCGDSNDSSGATSASPSSATASKPGYCADAERLQTSIRALTQVDVGQAGLPALKAALTDVQTKASTLATEARQELAPQTTALEEALTGLGTAADAAAATPSGGTLTGVLTALQQVRTAGTALAAATSGTCA